MQLRLKNGRVYGGEKIITKDDYLRLREEDKKMSENFKALFNVRKTCKK